MSEMILSKTSPENRGPESAGPEQTGLGERVLRELIRSPKFKSSLRIMVNGIDPSHAPGMVRALLWEDVETFMGTASIMPKIVNFMIQAAKETAVQLNAFPPEILLAFLSRLVGEIDFQALSEATREFRLLLEKLGPVVEGVRENSRRALGREEAG